MLDYIHNKLSSKYELYGDFQKAIDEYTKQLKSGDYEDRYVKNFIKQRLEGMHNCRKCLIYIIFKLKKFQIKT